MSDGEWVTVAMKDNSLVADILLRLRQAKVPSSSKSQPALQLEWSVRQRRSKQLQRKNEGESTRASPSTPLSWSDATSFSSSGGGGGGSGAVGGADGVVESSLQANARPMENVRSKAAVANESPNMKRPRRKRTLAELREEESTLLDERRELRNKLTTFYRTVERLKSTNENLKRMKFDLLSNQTRKLGTSSVASEETISDQLQQTEAAEDQICSNSATSAACDNPNPSLPTESAKVEEASCKDPSFLLPDLNLPCDNDSDTGVLCGIS